MYSRQESAALKQEFWTRFGQYMQPVLSAEGMPVNWINYKTGERNIFFKMFADNKHAYIGIEITHKEAGLRELYFQQFQELANFLNDCLKEAWIWQPEYTDFETGKTISRIYTKLEQVSIFKQEDWPAMIAFLKPRIIALDEFWNNVKPVFEALR